MRNKGLVALTMIAMLLITSVAMAAGNFYIPGSRDGEGGIGEDGKSFLNIHGTTDITMEGATSDAYEAIIRIPDPASDIVYTMPAASGTLATTAGGDLTLADTYLLIGNSGSKAIGVDMTGDVGITNAGVTSLAADSVDSAEIVANSVTKTELDYEVVDIYIDAAASSGTATVESGAILIGVWGIANIDDIGAEMYNGASITSTTLTLVLNGTAAGDSLHYGAAVINP